MHFPLILASTDVWIFNYLRQRLVHPLFLHLTRHCCWELHPSVVGLPAACFLFLRISAKTPRRRRIIFSRFESNSGLSCCVHVCEIGCLRCQCQNTQRRDSYRQRFAEGRISAANLTCAFTAIRRHDCMTIDISCLDCERD